MKCSNMKEDGCLEVYWDLLRGKEYILLAGLIETSSIYSDRKLLGVITVSHRIPNVAPVKKVFIKENMIYKMVIRASWVYLMGMITILLASILIPPRFSNIKYLDTETNKEVELFVNKNDSLVLYHDLFKQEKVSPKDIGGRFIQVYKHTKSPSYLIWMFLFLILCSVFILVEFYIRQYNSNRIWRLMETD